MLTEIALICKLNDAMKYGFRKGFLQTAQPLTDRRIRKNEAMGLPARQVLEILQKYAGN